MTVQDQIAVDLRYAAESTYGTQGSGNGQKLRRVSSSLALQKNVFSSNEARADQQLADVRHGSRSVSGNVDGELSTETYDDWLEAVMRDTWASGSTADENDLTSVTFSSGVATMGGGSLITAGFKVGDVVRFSDLTETANNNKNFLITALTATTMTLYPAPTDASADTAFTVAVQGDKLVNGTTRRSFTIEQHYPDVDISELFLGCRIGGANFRLPPNGMAEVSWNIMGRDSELKSSGNAPVYGSAAAETTTGLLAGPSGVLILNGAASGIITGLDFSLNLNLNQQPVVGSNLYPDTFYGRSVVTGNVSAYIEDTSILSLFDAETAFDIVALCEAAGTGALDFLSFGFHNCKFTGYSQSRTADGGAIASFPFQAVLKTGGASTAYDQSTMVVQRSNS